VGLLDDAIREHLELKRRHGADAAEIERIESEALASARAARESEGAGEAVPDSLADVHEVPPLADAPEPPPLAYEATAVDAPPAPEPAVSPAVPDDPELGYAAGLGDPPPSPVEPLAETAEHAAIGDEEDVEERAPAHAAAPAPSFTDFEADDDIFAPEPEAPPPPEPGAEAEADVLEETPDFLEETPEHDRLWFEQKPPRDFDFDR